MMLLFLLVLLISTMVTNQALAYASRRYNNIDGVLADAVAIQDVWKVSAYAWDAKIRSVTQSPNVSIGTIGWNWWTFRDTCNGAILWQAQIGGHAEYNDGDAWDIGFASIHQCAGTYLGHSLGKHDFEDVNSWFPEFSTAESLD